MAAVNKSNTSNGYGEKIQVKIITVDKEKYRVECATRDGAMIWVAVWETGTVFRWPEVGETWTVRKDTGVWRLDQIVQTELAEAESEATPKTLEELPEGDTRIIGETVHMNKISANGVFYDYGIVEALPTGATKDELCSFKASTGVYWRLVYTGEETYPWAKIGGPKLRAAIGEATVNTETPTAPGGLTIPAPLAIEADLEYGANRAIPPSGAFSRCTLFVGGVGVGEAVAGPTNQNPLYAVNRVTVAKGAVVENRVSRVSGSASINFIIPYVTVNPMRVG
jgi:hypothetical protein